MTNNHLTHLEDLLWTPEWESIFDYMLAIKAWLEGKENSVHISTKWDGAPAFIVGNDSKGFFVGTKGGITNLDKRFYSFDQIRKTEQLSKELMQIMEYLFFNLSRKVFPKAAEGIFFQGDLMFWPGESFWDIQEKTFSFKPNTIRYTYNYEKVPTRFLNASIGVAFHTKYDSAGGHLLKEDVFKNNSNCNGCYFFPVSIPRPSILLEVGDANSFLFHKGLASEFCKNNVLMEMFYKNNKAKQWISGYINQCVVGLMDPTAAGFIDFIKNKRVEVISKLKTRRGTANARAEMDEIFQNIGTGVELEKMFQFYLVVVRFKEQVISILNKDQDDALTMHLPGGIQCGHEGYVACLPNEKVPPVKLVSRWIFSRANFSEPRIWKNNILR